MYGAEVYIHQTLLKSRYITKDPKKASLFYVPWYLSCHIHTVNPPRGLPETASEIVTMLITEYPYWNRTSGRDHVWTFTHDTGACLALRDVSATDLLSMPCI